MSSSVSQSVTVYLIFRLDGFSAMVKREVDRTLSLREHFPDVELYVGFATKIVTF